MTKRVVNWGTSAC